MAASPPYYLRLSATPACGYACPYCQPSGPDRGPSTPGSLSNGELERLVRTLAAAGVVRVRLTGGEPLLRPDCADLVARLRAIDGIREVALTTNGELLTRRAWQLANAGLGRVNVHLDTLRPDRFEQLTGRDRHADVLRGIVAAHLHGLAPIKINVVLMKGINDDELVDFCAWGLRENLVVRFIELMDTGPARPFVSRHFLSGAEARQRIVEQFELTPRFDHRGGSPAREFLLDGGAGRIGFIEAESQPFCERCNRLRLTHDGRLSACLFGDGGVPLAPLLADTDTTDAALVRAVDDLLAGKQPAHPAVTGALGRRFSMAAIGG